MKPTGAPAIDAIIILYDNIKELFSKGKKKLTTEEERKKVEKELSYANAAFAFAALFAIKAIFYFVGRAWLKGSISLAAAALTVVLLLWEKKLIIKRLNKIKTASDYMIGEVTKVPHIGKASKVTSMTSIKKR